MGLHCLPRPICPKTLDHYGRYIQSKISSYMYADIQDRGDLLKNAQT